MLIIILLLALNFGISWWNCYAVGKVWEETKAVGGFPRVLAWCGAIQSVIGFSSVIGALLGFIAYQLGYLPPTVLKGAVSLWYVLVIIPCVTTGLIITIESWNQWWRDRSLMNLGVAGYNTFAQIHNTVSMIQNFGPALDDVGDLFEALTGSDDIKGKAAGAAIFLVIVALAGGVLLTMVLIKKYSGTVALPGREALYRY